MLHDLGTAEEAAMAFGDFPARPLSQTQSTESQSAKEIDLIRRDERQLDVFARFDAIKGDHLICHSA